MRVLACNSPYEQGGIGQHFAQLVEESRAAGLLYRYYTPGNIPAADVLGAPIARPSWWHTLLQVPPLRWSPGWKSWTLNTLFDRHMARRLPDGASAYMGFVGKSLHTFRAARAQGYETLELVAANSHVDQVMRQHRTAARATGLHDSWLNDAQRRATRAEYALADRIYVHSNYVRASFVAAGIPSHKLVRTVLRPHPRFAPPAARPADGRFRMVYVGRLDATKGITHLVEAFAALNDPTAELTLVGGWTGRPMRRYLERAQQTHPNLTVAPGDPLPALHRADVFVHPTYEDGFGYAPMEALACGVPVIVTEDTGMKEYVQPGDNGYVVPTGDTAALIDHLQMLRRRPLAATTSLLPALTPSPPAPLPAS
ncbi:glycosyltransferase family 4 protein [Salisaeta longa]|uniref:glycosyltransferase family 4 protein n=1 Tax=Salisaeta longa TaxID=503170 RepID=UPI0003B4E3FB|nr:glycosyltransferase family 4 protein [Salisaeta longa]